MEIFLGIILLVAAVFLVVAVLMQSGKSHNLSGSIAGGAETFFGKTKGKVMDKMLSKITTVVAIAFVVIVVIVYVAQPDGTSPNKWFDNNSNLAGDTAETTAVETTAVPGAETTAGGTTAVTDSDEQIFDETTAE